MFFKENATASGQLSLGHASQEKDVLSWRGTQGSLPNLWHANCRAWARHRGPQGQFCQLCLSCPSPVILPSPLGCFHLPLEWLSSPSCTVAPGALCAPPSCVILGGEKLYSPGVAAPLSWLCFPCRIPCLFIYLLCLGHRFWHGLPCAFIADKVFLPSFTGKFISLLHLFCK